MSRRIDLPRDLDGQAFLAREARDRGVPWSRLRSRDLDAPFRGVRSPVGSIDSTYDRARAYEKRMPPTHVFSHFTAAIVHGIPLPHRARVDSRLHVTVPAGTRAPQIGGVVGHELRAELMDVEFLDGLPVTSPLQTWIDLGAQLRIDELVAAADYLCSGVNPRYTPIDLLVATTDLHGRRGCRALRQAAALARARVESPKETETRLLLTRAGLPEPIVAFAVRVAGDLVLHPDLAFPEFRVCVEYEGDRHRTEKKRFRSDITRRELLEDVGWRVVRITQDDLQDGGRMLISRVRKALAARGWTG